MSYHDTKRLRASVREYTRSNTIIALGILAFDLLLYAAAIAGVLLFDSTVLKLLCGVYAGMVVSSIFVISHDAAHDSFTGSKTLNQAIARLTYLLTLHNYSLWLTAHNRIHHQVTNIKEFNSWSPMSKEEYDAQPAGRRLLERIYRTVPGMCLYYIVERWWKHKFYPFKSIAGKYNDVYLDFASLMVYLCGYTAFLVYAGTQISGTTAVELLCFGLLVPFLTWNFMMGFTVYQHHTHETIAWTRNQKESRRMGGQADFTMHVRYPHWYNLISHNIMEHTAHHVDPRIPCYNLARAQQVLTEILGSKIHAMDFSLPGFLRTMRNCKLYDFDNHCWLDFKGRRTSEPLQLTTAKTEERVLQAA
ncbi:MAG: fatty acid desaturase [Thiotrichales bacterium]|nr:fatty acid desaturase [Thiotrichales bacterium]